MSFENLENHKKKAELKLQANVICPFTVKTNNVCPITVKFLSVFSDTQLYSYLGIATEGWYFDKWFQKNK